MRCAALHHETLAWSAGAHRQGVREKPIPYDFAMHDARCKRCLLIVIRFHYLLDRNLCLRIAYIRQGRVHPPSPKPEAERKTAGWKSKQQGHERNWQTRQRKEPEKTKRGRKGRERDRLTKRWLEKEETSELTQSARRTEQPRVCSKTDTSKADEKEQRNVRSWAR